MHAPLRGAILVLPFLTMLGSCAAGPLAPADLLVRNVDVVDPRTSTARRASIVIDDGVIRAVVEPASRVAATREIDGSGLFAIPGLWDAHVHLAEDGADPSVLAALVRHGVTGVRDAGSRLEILGDWQRSMESGAIAGPRVFAAGPTLNGPGDDSLHIEVTDRASAVNAVTTLAGQGVRWIKVHRLLAPDHLKVIIEEAHGRGLRVFGHVPHGMSPRQACEAGMDGIEHLGSVLESIVSVRQGGAEDLAAAVGELVSRETDAFVECLVERGTSFTPTLAIYRFLAGPNDAQRRMAERLIDALQPFVLRVHRAGVPILPGSDAPLDGAVPWGAALHEELALLEEAGLAPADVLRLATIGSAERISGADSTVMAGAAADLVLLRADPLKAVANLRAIAHVIVRGRPMIAR